MERLAEIVAIVETGGLVIEHNPWFNRLDRAGLAFDSLRPLKTLMQQINSAIDKIAKLACVKRTPRLIRGETFFV